MSVEIRLAGVDDGALLAGLGARTFAETYAAAIDADDLAAYVAERFTPERMQQELGDRRSRFYVAMSGGEPAGYAKLQETAPAGELDERAVELERIYVLRAHQGDGVGRALMERCLAEARASGSQTMWLGVWSENARAIRFYERLGFVVFGEQPFPMGRQVHTDYLLRLDLGEG